MLTKLTHPLTIRFVLVIKKIKLEYCGGTKGAIWEKIKADNAMCKIWKPKIFVMNEEEALERKFITKEVPEGANVIKNEH